MDPNLGEDQYGIDCCKAQKNLTMAYCNEYPGEGFNCYPKLFSRNGNWHSNRTLLPGYFMGDALYETDGGMDAIEVLKQDPESLVSSVVVGSTKYWDYVCEYYDAKSNSTVVGKAYQCAREQCKIHRAPCKAKVLAAYAACKYALGRRKITHQQHYYGYRYPPTFEEATGMGG